ncbi:peptidoglycan/LPS O-acetylase OafA/YrhL [Streptacidiphilus sp. MAP12-33]|uniref:hypothetical protein n=1 Tax=Streptacidiphilus sp. MAP12-33 TaxID=3156266 RepID=UPI003511F9C2
MLGNLSQDAVHWPPTVIAVFWIGQLVRAYGRREEPWTARQWVAAAILVVGAAGFALAGWWGRVVLATAVAVVTAATYVLLDRRPGTAERPYSPEGEQGRSEP